MYNKTAYQLGDNSCYIRTLHEYGCSRAKIVGEDNVFDFSIGNPGIPAPAEVTEALQDIIANTDPMELHAYVPAVGELATRQAIADDLNSRYGCQLTPQEFFIGCGSSQELCAVFRALAFPEAEFVVIAPYFPEYAPFISEAGGKLRVVPADIPDFQINLKALEDTLTPNTAAVVINSPNNPAGTVYSAQTLRALAQILERKSAEYGRTIYIVSDEPYRELVYGGVQVPYLPAIYPHTIICYSYSKSLSLPGERIGYILVPNCAQDHEALYTAISGASRAIGHICAPSLWQRVIARCAHLKPDLTVYEKNRTLLCQGLEAAGYTVAKPDGAFYLFVKAPGGNSVAFSEKAMQEDLLVVPGDDFGCPEYFRLCYCVKYETIEKSLPLFAKLI